MNKGLDVGTNMLVSAELNEEGIPVYKMQRDAFYTIVPKSPVNRNSIKISLDKKGASYITSSDAFTVVGNDALEIAIERNDIAKRPLYKGVLSPKEKDSLPMLKMMIEDLVGKGNGDSTLVYSVPAAPIDSDFDITYHKEMIGAYVRDMGYKPQAMNEAFAIALSELIDDGITGITLSYGAGMTNVAVVHEGDSLIEFSITRGGDYIDQSVGTALDISPSLVQLEKEDGTDLLNPTNKIMEAVSVYYGSVISYTLKNIAYELNNRKKVLPMFRNPVPIVVSGGLTLANGFIDKTNDILKEIDFPIAISSVKRATNPMTAVANGCLLAAQL